MATNEKKKSNNHRRPCAQWIFALKNLKKVYDDHSKRPRNEEPIKKQNEGAMIVSLLIVCD